MASFFSFLIKRKWPARERVTALLNGPLTWVAVLFYAISALILVLTYILIIQLNNKALVTVPAHGGTVREGIIGSPRFINPILATTDTDVSITKIVYAGLFRENVEGVLIPELAREYSISPNSLTYTVSLKENILFHDKTPLTAQDVLFTIQKLQDANLNPATANFWQTISIEAIDDQTVAFNLPSENEDFLTNLTFGILPKHIWENQPNESYADPKLNLSPIGAGPMKLKGVSETNGIVTELYFVKNRKYVGNIPYIKDLRIEVFANQLALYNGLVGGDIDMTSALDPQTISTHQLPKRLTVSKIPITKSVGLYRHTSESTLDDTAFVRIIDSYIDKERILAKVENGYGTPNTVPGVEGMSLENTEAALESLQSIGYTYTNGTLMHSGAPVGFSISVENNPRSLLAAQTLAEELGKLGLIISIKAFDPGNFHDEVQSSRSHVVLVRAESITLPASYRPAILLYERALPYIIDESVIGATPHVLIHPTLRYENIDSWYVETDKIWKVFIKDSNK